MMMPPPPSCPFRSSYCWALTSPHKASQSLPRAEETQRHPGCPKREQVKAEHEGWVGIHPMPTSCEARPSTHSPALWSGLLTPERGVKVLPRRAATFKPSPAPALPTALTPYLQGTPRATS